MTDYLFDPPAVASLPVQGLEARFPVHRIFCVGRNYHAHAIEMGRPVDKSTMQPFYFCKSASALVLSGATVAYPPGTTNYHYEMELVVAIGAEGFRVAPADAAALIYGYACGLDMTRRDLQFIARDQGRPWDVSKNFEASAVCGPIVAKQALAGLPGLDAQGVLQAGPITLHVNGVCKQAADVSQLIWSIPELLADLSQYYHLRAGDLLYTGTPEGVGPVLSGDALSGQIAHLAGVALQVGPAQ